MDGKQEESIPMNQMEKKMENDDTADQGEKEPLKPQDDKTNLTDGKSNGKEKDGSDTGSRVAPIFTKVTLRLLLAIISSIVIITLVIIIIIVCASSGKETKEDVVDTTPRLMSMLPKPNEARNLLHYRHGHEEKTGKARVLSDLANLDQIMELYDRYEPSKVLSGDRNISDCTNAPPGKDSVCYYDIGRIKQMCLETELYGYPSGEPCIYIQFNNVSDWTPQPYSTTDLETNDVPNQIKINYRPDLAYVVCEGNTAVDKENLGEIEYIPQQGFPARYFPYNGHPYYMNPFFAIKPKKPAVGIAIGITCRLWAKNIDTENDVGTAESPSGFLPFNLLID